MNRSRGIRILVCLTITLEVSLAVAQSTTFRGEQDDPSVTYTGNGYKNGASANSGGSAALTNTLDARAAIAFTGTGISWIGVGDPWSGFARVYLDGLLNTVDTHASATAY